MIAAIVLAAGRGERFGSDKRLHQVNGQPLSYYSLHACVESTLPSLYVVTGAAQGRIKNLVEELFPANRRIHFVKNPLAARGRMTSVQAGLRALPPEVDGAMIVLADMPLVTSELIDSLIAVFDDRGVPVVCENGGAHYHPKILPRHLFSQFMELGDNEKGTAVLGASSEQIVTVRVPDRALFLDVDTPVDLIEPARRLTLSR